MSRSSNISCSMAVISEFRGASKPIPRPVFAPAISIIVSSPPTAILTKSIDACSPSIFWKYCFSFSASLSFNGSDQLSPNSDGWRTLRSQSAGLSSRICSVSASKWIKGGCNKIFVSLNCS